MNTLFGFMRIDSFLSITFSLMTQSESNPDSHAGLIQELPFQFAMRYPDFHYFVINIIPMELWCQSMTRSLYVGYLTTISIKTSIYSEETAEKFEKPLSVLLYERERLISGRAM